MINNILPKFKVLEANNLTAQRMGHVLAQMPCYLTASGDITDVTASKSVEDYKFLENGTIVGLNGGILSNFDSAKHAIPMVVFNEELISANYLSGLDQYAMEGGTKACYPRSLPLYVGDTFTTNNFSGEANTAKFAKVTDGVLVLQTVADNDTLFVATKTTMPDTTTVGVEFQYQGKALA